MSTDDRESNAPFQPQKARPPVHYYVFLLDGPSSGKHLRVTDKAIIPKLAEGFVFNYTYKEEPAAYEVVRERSPGAWTARLQKHPSPAAEEA